MSTTPRSPQSASRSAPVEYSYEIVHTYPHDPAAFTQGLYFRDGFVYEGTGGRGRSTIRQTKLETGEVIRQQTVPAEHFGEGITIRNSELIELTWRSQVAFVYDVDTFALRRTVSVAGEGWGLTHDAIGLIMSDGTDTLRFLDPDTFVERRVLQVVDASGPLRGLNELEMVKGEIFANVFKSDSIARIDPATGRVKGWIDCTGLLPPSERSSIEAVMNGIAYDREGDRLFVTGKFWPKLFELRVIPRRR